MTGSTPGRRRAAGLAAYGLAFAVAGATPLAGCRGEPTSIVIQVNTNLTAATEVDEVHIIVVEVGLGLQPSRDEVFKIRGAGELPVVLGLYPSGDPRIDVDVSARAALQGCLIAEQRASTHFVPDHVERLTIDLTSACHTIACPSGQACSSGSCVDCPGGGGDGPETDGGADGGP